MPPDYVHRVGRTGRAGQPGLTIMFVIPTRDIPFLTNVENYIGEKLTEMKIDGNFFVHCNPFKIYLHVLTFYMHTLQKRKF